MNNICPFDIYIEKNISSNMVGINLDCVTVLNYCVVKFTTLF